MDILTNPEKKHTNRTVVTTRTCNAMVALGVRVFGCSPSHINSLR
jgi:hypothetical protein